MKGSLGVLTIGFSGCAGLSADSSGDETSTSGEPTESEADESTTSSGTETPAEGTETTDESTSDGESTETDGSEDGDSSSLDHPSAEGAEKNAKVGPSMDEAEGVMIAFEDPSSPSCAKFHEAVFPKLKSRLIDSGYVTFVARAYPNTEEWAETAVLALKATYDRDEGAYWDLKAHYYENQGDLNEENVLDETEAFLDDETSVDAGAVVSDVEGGAYEDALASDVDAAENAEVSDLPTLFLFEDGEFKTELTGKQSYAVLKSVLGE